LQLLQLLLFSFFLETSCLNFGKGSEVVLPVVVPVVPVAVPVELKQEIPA
jgi:hypothetical protein